jgi:outer membrane protein TolC
MITGKVKVLIISVLLVSSGAGAAQAPAKLTLRQCLEYALENSHSMNICQLESKESAAKTKEISASVLPQVNASASMTDNLAIPVVMLPGEIIGMPGEMIPAELGVQYETNAAVQLSQVIFNPALFSGIKAARNAEELLQLKTKLTKEQLIFDVASVFYNILHSEQQLKSVKGNIALQDSLYAKTALRVKEELTREIDLNRIKVNITGLNVQLESLLAAIEQQKRYLQVLSGMSLNEPFSLDDSVLDEMSFPETALNGNEPFLAKTELALLQKHQELNALELKTVRMQYVPTLSFVASGAYQFQSEELQLGNKENWFKSAFIGLQLSIPLFDGFFKRHRITQIKLQRQKLESDWDYAKQSIQMEQENARTELLVSYRSMKAQEENFRLAEQVYGQCRLLYQEGLYNVTDLLQTENALREAQTAYIVELIRFKKAGLNLMKADGKLEELIEN